MKRFLFILVLAISLNGCNDGDLTIEDINFDNVTAQRCNNLIYKLAQNEALIIDIPVETALVNEPTTPGTPLSFPLDATHRVVYRSYNGTVASNNICGTIQPTTPIVTEEWTASSGMIEITTTPVKINSVDFPGGEQITGYKHTIIFRNITFVKPNGNQLYETFPFGDYTTSITPLPFNFDGTLEKCSSTNLLFDYVGNEAITLNIDPSLLVNTVTPIGQPRTGLIGTDVNVLTYHLFASGPLTSDYFCADPVPATPAISETWTGNDGIAGVSGIVEVTTTTNGLGFLHEIHLKNVTLKKGNSEFLLATDYLFGQYITN